jgi:hypothetical protein
MAFVKGGAEPVQGLEVAQIEGNEGGRAALGADRIVDLLESALGARDQDELRAFTGEAFGNGGADAARGAGDDGDATVQAAAHVPSRNRTRLRNSATSRFDLARTASSRPIR